MNLFFGGVFVRSVLLVVLNLAAPAANAWWFEQGDCPTGFGLGDVVDYNLDIQPIFDANCVVCHQPGTDAYQQVGLDLRPGESYWNLMGRRSAQIQRALVHPWSANALLFSKLLCTEPVVGARMPKGQPRLGSVELSKILTWRQFGAMPGIETQSALETQPGLAGSWFDPATSGQGMVIELIPLESFTRALVYWFTFSDQDAAGQTVQRWYLADGILSPQASAFLRIYTATGGAFDRPEPEAETEQVGRAVIKFQSCTEATFAYHLYPEDDGQEARTGEIHLERLSPFENCED